MDNFIKEYLFAWEKAFELTKKEYDAGFVSLDGDSVTRRLDFHLYNIADLIKRGGIKNG